MAKLGPMRSWTVYILALAASVSGGLGTLWLVRTPTRFFVDPDAPGLFTVLEAHGDAVESSSFTTQRPIEHFHVYTRVDRSGQEYSLSLAGDDGLFLSFNGAKGMSFGWGKNVPAGTYTLTLAQADGHSRVVAYVADRPVGLTGWQLLCRILAGVVFAVAVWAAFTVRRRSSQQYDAVSVLQRLAVVLICIFLYLLLHEGGHALASLAFGRYDLSRSDFWGLHGTPHSGIRADVSIEPWQRAIQSFAGPTLPILTGWALFAWWCSAMGRRTRKQRTLTDLLSSTLIALFLFTALVGPGCSLGLISDGDWRGYSDNMPGPTWLAHFLVWVIFVVSAVMFVRVIGHAAQCWRTRPPGPKSATRGA